MRTERKPPAHRPISTKSPPLRRMRSSALWTALNHHLSPHLFRTYECLTSCVSVETPHVTRQSMPRSGTRPVHSPRSQLDGSTRRGHMVHELAARPGITERDATSRPTPCTATTDRSSLRPITWTSALSTRMGDRPSAPHSGAVVRGLTTSRMFALAVGVYQQHRRDGGGRCLRCGSRVCRSRRQAATVIEAAGVRPADIELAGQCGLRERGPWPVGRVRWPLIRRCAPTTPGHDSPPYVVARPASAGGRPALASRPPARRRHGGVHSASVRVMEEGNRIAHRRR